MPKSCFLNFMTGTKIFIQTIVDNSQYNGTYISITPNVSKKHRKHFMSSKQEIQHK